MPLLPIMQFAFDDSWPTSTASVFMTAMKVWGPLSVGLLAAFLFAPWWVALVGLAVSGFVFWIDPHFYESVNWEEEGGDF